MSAIPGRVSVTMPCYNSLKGGKPWFREAIESVLSQDWPDVELICADDGSTDGCADVAESYGPRVKVLRLPHRGLVATRNAAVAAATGEYLATLDHDDRYLPGRLRRGVELLRNHPETSFAWGPVWVIDGGGHRQHVHPLPEGATSRTLETMVFGNFIHSPSVTMRTELVRQVGAYEPDFGERGGEDFSLYVRLLMTGPAVFDPEPLGEYRWFGANNSDHVQCLFDSWVVQDRIMATYPHLRSLRRRAQIGLHIAVADRYSAHGNHAKAWKHRIWSVLSGNPKDALWAAYVQWAPAWVKKAWQHLKRNRHGLLKFR